MPIEPNLTRRAALTGLASVGAAALPWPLGAAQAARTGLARLRPGDKVGLVAPAGFIADDAELALVLDTVRAMQLEPVAAPNLTSRYGYLAGTDEERAAGVNAMFRRDDLAAVFAVRGGWGCARILPMLDYDAIRANPVIFTGFSDITAMHLAFAAMKAGYPTLHCPNASASWPRASWDAYQRVAFEGEAPTFAPEPGTDDRLVQRSGRVETYGEGRATGWLLGGNLTVLSALVGTPYLPDFTGAILFLEDVGEAPYRIDRMLTQLRLAGILDRVAGVVFGQCTRCEDNGASLSNFTLHQVLDQHLSGLGVPAFGGAQFGHVGEQIVLPVTSEAQIDAKDGTIRILAPVVS